jgi:membrane-associated phospholipid phosphatase
MKLRIFLVFIVAAFALIGLDVHSSWAQTAPTNPSLGGVGASLTSDFKYVANNFQLDGEDIITAPLHLDAAGAMLTNPRFYLVLGGAGAAFGGAFGLDKIMRANLHDMSSSTATMLQNISYGSVSAATALLYGYGLYTGNARARHYALTAGEGAGIATLLDIGIKTAFGRLRPRQDNHNHLAFFDGGQSFVSGDVTPMFGLACGVSEYYDNRWYIAGPIYSLALLDGFGRMGHDAHWFSDVIGAALLGVGTTELLIYLHHQHELEPNRFRIFPISAPVSSPTASQNVAPEGLMVAFSW